MTKIDDSKLLELLSLNSEQISFLESVIEYSKAETDEEKESLADRIQKHWEKKSSIPTILELSSEKFELYSQWYHQVIRSLIGLYSFSGDYEWLAQKLSPPITAQKAQESVELLFKLGLIDRDRDGVYHLAENHISTGTQVEKEVLRDYYRTMTAMGIDALSSVEQHERNISGLTLGISAGKYEAVVNRIAAMRKELIALAENDTEADRVYNITTLCFPLSSREKE